jgi:hypothetical protein
VTRVSSAPNENGYHWAGGVAQMIERLPTKYEALSSNPVTIKNKKRKILLSLFLRRANEGLQDVCIFSVS